ncbi:MAG: hypothetical protein JSV32_04495 [Dehalococcoidia bacterium]|nr:MAG: hypothetical protein JSV32_04495 [Dehalococcoidia bacterium]
MEISFIIISVIATVILAIFTWRTWRISNEQHKLYHDPDLSIFSLDKGLNQFEKEIEYDEDALLTYNALIVNHGRIPIVITDVWENISDEVDNKDLHGLFHVPPGVETGAKQLLLELPVVIPSGDFITCNRECEVKAFYKHLTEESRNQLSNSINVKIEYYTTKDAPKIVNKNIPLYVGRIKDIQL